MFFFPSFLVFLLNTSPQEKEKGEEKIIEKSRSKNTKLQMEIMLLFNLSIVWN